MKSYARQFTFCLKPSDRFGMAVEVSSIQRQVNKKAALQFNQFNEKLMETNETFRTSAQS